MIDYSKYEPLDEEEQQAMRDMSNAMDRNDKEAQRKLWPKIKAMPHSLKAAKKLLGADYIRQKGFNTELADKEFGPGWLDE